MGKTHTLCDVVRRFPFLKVLLGEELGYVQACAVTGIDAHLLMSVPICLHGPHTSERCNRILILNPEGGLLEEVRPAAVEAPGRAEISGQAVIEVLKDLPDLSEVGYILCVYARRCADPGVPKFGFTLHLPPKERNLASIVYVWRDLV